MNSTAIPEPSLSSPAMLCSPSSMWSARKHDPKPPREIARRHGAQADAGLRRAHRVSERRQIEVFFDESQDAAKIVGEVRDLTGFA